MPDWRIIREFEDCISAAPWQRVLTTAQSQLPGNAGVDLFGTTITDGQAYLRTVLWPHCMAQAAAAWHHCRVLVAAAHEQLPAMVFAVRSTHSRLVSALAHVEQTVPR